MASDIRMDRASGTITVALDGMRRIAAMKSSVSFPASSITGVYGFSEDLIGHFRGLGGASRLLARVTSNPMLRHHYYGGSFVDSRVHPHEREFWDVDSEDPIVVFELRGQPFQRVYVSTTDPSGLIDGVHDMISRK